MSDNIVRFPAIRDKVAAKRECRSEAWAEYYRDQDRSARRARLCRVITDICWLCFDTEAQNEEIERKVRAVVGREMTDSEMEEVINRTASSWLWANGYRRKT